MSTHIVPARAHLHQHMQQLAMTALHIIMFKNRNLHVSKLILYHCIDLNLILDPQTKEIKRYPSDSVMDRRMFLVEEEEEELQHSELKLYISHRAMDRRIELQHWDQQHHKLNPPGGCLICFEGKGSALPNPQLLVPAATPK